MISNFVSRKSQRAKRESFNTTLGHCKLQNTIAFTYKLPNSIPHLNTLPSVFAKHCRQPNRSVHKKQCRKPNTLLKPYLNTMTPRLNIGNEKGTQPTTAVWAPFGSRAAVAYPNAWGASIIPPTDQLTRLLLLVLIKLYTNGTNTNTYRS